MNEEIKTFSSRFFSLFLLYIFLLLQQIHYKGEEKKLKVVVFTREKCEISKAKREKWAGKFPLLFLLHDGEKQQQDTQQIDRIEIKVEATFSSWENGKNSQMLQRLDILSCSPSQLADFKTKLESFDPDSTTSALCATVVLCAKTSRKGREGEI